MFQGRRLVVTTAAAVMLATLLGAPAEADPAAVKLTLSYAQRCEDPGALLKPPTARLLRADESPVVGETVSWTWQAVTASGHGDAHVYGTAVTDTTGTAHVDGPAVPLDQTVRWRLTSTASAGVASSSKTAYQNLLRTDGSRGASGTMRWTPTRPNYYGQWVASGYNVTQMAVGEGTTACPRMVKTGAPVDVQYRPYGSNSEATAWKSAGTTTVDAEGRWQLLFLPEAAGKYQLRARIGASHGASEADGGNTDIELRPGLADVDPLYSRPIVLTGAGHRQTLSHTLVVSSILHGPWRPTDQKRSADLWFIDKYTKSRKFIRSFRDIPVLNGKAVFVHRLAINRSGTYILRYAGLPIEAPAEGYTEVAVNPTLRGWPRDGRKTSLRKHTVRTRTITVGSLQSSKQRVALLWRRPGADWIDDGAIKTYKPNRFGKVKIRIPSGWRGKRQYRVYVGDVNGSGREIYPVGGTFSGRWTITRK